MKILLEENCQNLKPYLVERSWDVVARAHAIIADQKLKEIQALKEYL